jgi:peptide/nickel transport system ATP-binding protein
MGILPYNAQMGGTMWYRGEPLTKERIRKLRGKEILMVPQSLSYLDPLMKTGEQIRNGKKDEKSKKKLKEIFQRYHLKEEVEEKYPFELSGGMSRRILISTAMIEEPHLVIADEPTPGLDLAMAKRAMSHFRELADMGAGVLVITHDLELALEVADRIVVFYAGTTVEEANVSDFQQESTLRHPYTKALWRALPQNGFQFIEGSQPYVKDMPEGCPFAPRCERCTEACKGEIPYRSVRGGKVRCVKGEEGGDKQ